jgi:catechol 2,3-dioxygenase-like lactoylglutathione lyase family enzyme
LPHIPYTRLSHFGIMVRDLDRMIAFYRRVLGFMVSDRGEVRGIEVAFLSRDPKEHHQVVFAKGRPEGQPSQIFQLSLELNGLAELRAMHQILVADPEVTDIAPRAHGVSFSLYFKDVEGNTIETFVPTPWYIPSPAIIPYDFSMTDEQIFNTVRDAVKGIEGFRPYREWQAEAAARMEEAGVWFAGR